MPFFDRTVFTNTLAIPKTPTATSWHTVLSNPVKLSAGEHVMRIEMDAASAKADSAGGFDWFEVIPLAGPSSINWKPGPASTLKQFEGQGRVIDGKLYTFGGYTAVAPFGANPGFQVYDPATKIWTNLGTMPIPQTHFGIAADPSTGIIYFVGGLRGTYPGVATSDVYQYDTRTGVWTQLPSLPQNLSAGSSALVNGKLHYFGGDIGQARDIDQTLHYVLDLSDPKATWQPAAPLPQVRDHASDAVIDGKIYLLGGEIGHDTFHQQQNACYVYDPATDSWSRIADLPVPRSHAESSTFVQNGKIILAGGQVDDYLATSSILEYDPAANQWYVLPSLPKAMEGTIVQPIGNQLILTGGYDGLSGISSNATWLGALPPIPAPAGPFHGTPFLVGQTIEAEDFDTGGEGIAYHDTTPANLGAATSRPGESVDLIPGGSGGCAVGYTAAGEWLDYTIDIATDGFYRVQASAACPAAGAMIHASFDSLTSTPEMSLPKTATWASWETITSAPVKLTAGIHVMRIFIDHNATGIPAAGNYDWFKVLA